jgi:hypothetical protein
MRAAFLEVERRALADVWAHKKLLAAHLVGNALLALLAYAWLSMPDQTVSQLVISALVAVLALFTALWLHAAALAAFHPVGQARGLAVVTLRRLPKLLPWAVLAAAVVAVVVWLAGYQSAVTANLASRFTLWWRRPVSPQSVDWLYPALLRSLGLIVLLALLPLASQAAGGGFSRRNALRVIGRWRYWLACALLVLVGIFLPGRLVWWILPVKGLFAEAVSVIVRFTVAYILAVTAWLTLAAVIGRLGSERKE